MRGLNKIEVKKIYESFPTDLKASFLFVTYNRAPFEDFAKNPITWAFSSILEGEYPQVVNDFVVVADGCTDYTIENIEWLKKKYKINIRIIINIKRKGCSLSRSIGIRKLKNDKFFMGDDDCLYRKDFVIGSLAVFLELEKKYKAKLAVLNLPVFEMDVDFSGEVNKGLIGSVDYKKAWFNHNFDKKPLPHSGYKNIESVKFSMPFRVKTFKGVTLNSKQAILSAGNFPDLSMWQTDYSEHIELSHKLIKKGYVLYHLPDPRVSASHIKFGSVYKHKIPVNIKFRGSNLTLEEIASISEKFGKDGGGCRVDEASFVESRIGSFTAFFIKVSLQSAKYFITEEYNNFVIGNTYNPFVPKVNLSKVKRRELWEKSVKKGIETASVETGKSYKNVYKFLTNNFKMVDSIAVNKFKVVLFDFHNTLSNGSFYIVSGKKTGAEINKKIFSAKNYENLKEWMRGEINYKVFNKIVSKQTGVSANKLNELLIVSMKQFKYNTRLLNFAGEIKKKGVITAIITDNMDVFEKHIASDKDFAANFDYIFSSSRFGLLKDDSEGKFFKVALKELGVEIENCLLIDDSKKTCELFEKNGGSAYCYDDYANGFLNFINWYENK